MDEEVEAPELEATDPDDDNLGDGAAGCMDYQDSYYPKDGR